MQLYMPTVTPSTCVTCRHASDPNNVPCDIVGRATCNSQMPGLHMHRWFSGRIPTSPPLFNLQSGDGE